MLNLWRDFQKIAANPEANSTQVPGSGTTPGPQGPPFFFLPPLSPSSPAQQPLCSVPFFLPGPQRPEGMGGGEIGIQDPPPIGSYNVKGPRGPDPGPLGRFNRADWNGTGGACVAVPMAGIIGSSNFTAGGSTGAAACCGSSSTRLAQRPRAVMRPSVMTFSPLCSVSRRRVQ